MTETQSGKDPALAAQHTSEARSQLYALFTDILEYPDDGLVERIHSQEIAKQLTTLLQAISPKLAEAINDEALSPQISLDDFQVEHTLLFDGAASKDPCQLYGSSYIESRDRAVEEPLRFYDYFGLKLSQEAREFPDYIGTQLEFLHYLSYCQSGAVPDIADLESFTKAEKDFLERHPGHWVPKLHKRIQSSAALPFYEEIIRLLKNFLLYMCD